MLIIVRIMWIKKPAYCLRQVSRCNRCSCYSVLLEEYTSWNEKFSFSSAWTSRISSIQSQCIRGTDAGYYISFAINSGSCYLGFEGWRSWYHIAHAYADKQVRYLKPFQLFSTWLLLIICALACFKLSFNNFYDSFVKVFTYNLICKFKLSFKLIRKFEP